MEWEETGGKWDGNEGDRGRGNGREGRQGGGGEGYGRGNLTPRSLLKVGACD